MGQGQPRVIIWTTLVVLPYTMLHTMFQGHRSIGSGEEDFLRFSPYMGMAAMLVMWPRPFEHLFFPKGPRGCIWNLVAIDPVVAEEKSFEIVDGRQTDDGRTTEPAYTISSPGAFGSGELKRGHCSLNHQKKITHKVWKWELLVLYATHRHDLFYIAVKYHDYIPPIVKSEVLYYNNNLSSVWALHIHDRVQKFSDHVSKHDNESLCDCLTEASLMSRKLEHQRPTVILALLKKWGH